MFLPSNRFSSKMLRPSVHLAQKESVNRPSFPQLPRSSMRSRTRPAFASKNFPPHPIRCARPSKRNTNLRKGNRMTEVLPHDTIRCDACPVLCYIKRGQTGACDRYGNFDGQLVRVDPHILLDRAKSQGTPLVPFLESEREWDGSLLKSRDTFVTAIGAGT